MNTTFLKSIIFSAATIFSISVFSGPSCNWEHKNTDTKILDIDIFVVDSYKCVIPDWDTSDEPDTYKAHVLKSDGRQIPIEASNDYQGINLLETTPKTLNAVYLSRPGNSNVGNLIRIFDNNWNHLITLDSPVNEYQSNKKRGSEYKVVGFFRMADDYYIENIRSLGGECNACQQYVVDTYKVDNNNLVVVDTRDFDIYDYKRYADEQ